MKITVLMLCIDPETLAPSCAFARTFDGDKESPAQAEAEILRISKATPEVKYAVEFALEMEPNSPLLVGSGADFDCQNGVKMDYSSEGALAGTMLNTEPGFKIPTVEEARENFTKNGITRESVMNLTVREAAEKGGLTLPDWFVNEFGDQKVADLPRK